MSNSYGLVLQIDFEKAFDTINWDFIDKSLCNYNIGISFRKWVKILYTNSKSAVMNNGNFTQFFHLQRGVRQGCPLSAFLFLLVVELLANRIRASNKIKGIKLQNGVLKVSQMADDATIFLSSIDEVTPLLAVLETFAMCSGLKTNVEKTKVYPINNIDKTKNIMPGLNLEHGPIRLLGLTITCNQKVHFEENIKPKLMLMHNLLNIWSSRNLSLKGKITVINSLIVPLFIYPASIMEIDKDTLVEIDAALFKFLWSNRKPKIAKNVIQGQYKDGGLKMPNIFEKVNAWQLIWLKRAQLNPHRMWVKIIDSIIKDIKFTDLMYTHSMLNNKYVTKLPLFYQKMLTLWNKIRTHDTGSVQSIQSQIIWLNDSVTIEKKIFFWEKWYRHGIVRIKDLLDSNGNFLSPENMQTKYNIRCSFIETLQIRQAIPFQWRKLLRTSNKIHDTSDGICTDSNVKPIDIQYLTSSQIYWALMSAKKKGIPACIKKWYLTFNFTQSQPTDDKIWNKIFLLPFKSCQEPYLQSFQYRIIHRIFPSNYWLNILKIKENPTCEFCDEDDTIEHYFVYCHTVRGFWNSFAIWWANLFKVNLILDECLIIFGVDLITPDTYLFNYCVILAKYYLYCQKRSLAHNLDFYRFLPYLKQTLEYKYIHHKLMDKQYIFDNKWGQLYNNI